MYLLFPSEMSSSLTMTKIHFCFSSLFPFIIVYLVSLVFFFFSLRKFFLCPGCRISLSFLSIHVLPILSLDETMLRDNEGCGRVECLSSLLVVSSTSCFRIEGRCSPPVPSLIYLSPDACVCPRDVLFFSLWYWSPLHFLHLQNSSWSP